jgi:hypothetical protein
MLQSRWAPKPEQPAQEESTPATTASKNTEQSAPTETPPTAQPDPQPVQVSYAPVVCLEPLSRNIAPADSYADYLHDV